MGSAKETVQKILDDLPDDSSMDEIIRELAFKKMIQKGLQESKSEKIISETELHKEIQKW